MQKNGEMNKNKDNSRNHFSLHKKTEKVLQKNGKYFKDITEKFSDFIIITDKNADIKYCSLSIERFTGYKSEEVIGNSAFRFVHPDDISRVSNDYGRAILTDENNLVSNKFRIIHKNGSVIYLEGLGRNLLNNQDIAGFVMNIHDITERRKAEELVRKSEERYRLLAEHTKDTVWIMDMDMKVTYVSPSTEKLLGYSSEEHTQLSLDKTLTSASFKAVMDFFTTEISRAPVTPADYVLNQTLELEFRCKDGRIVWEECMFSLIRDENGKVVSILGEGRNITERKQMEYALRESETNFRHTLDESPLGVRISTIEGETLYANRSILDMYGYDSVEELKNTSIKERYTPESYAEFQARKEKRLMGEFGPSEYEISIIRKDGEIRHVQVFRKEILWDGKKQYQVIYQDITGRKLAEEKLNRTLENLRQSIKTTIQVLGLASEARDPYTAGHHKRVSSLARAIAAEKGLSQDVIESIRMAGSIHDIGKIAVPGEILSKSTKLSDNEFSLIKEHPHNGYEMLKHVESPWPLAQIVYQHHERMDGSGYPKHLKGNDILMEARIMAVADVVDAMSCHRPYRPALGIDAALEEIEINRGILYDETVVDACLKLFREKNYQFT